MEHKMHRKQTGFGLIEILVVIILVASLGLYAYSKWTGNTLQLDGQFKQLEYTIQLGQNLAMQKGKNFQILFDKNKNQYQLLEMKKDGNSKSIFKTILPSGIQFSQIDTITFNNKGIPTSGAGTPIKLVSNTGQSRQLVISPETGTIIQ